MEEKMNTMSKAELILSIETKTDLAILFVQLGAHIIRNSRGKLNHFESMKNDIYHATYVLDDGTLLMLDGKDAMIRFSGDGSIFRESNGSFIFTGKMDSQSFIEKANKMLGKKQ